MIETLSLRVLAGPLAYNGFGVSEASANAARNAATMRALLTA
jgi:hypothetical protein